MKKEFIDLTGKTCDLHLGNDNNNSEVLMGSNQTIIISKEYGPACFSNLRVSAVTENDWCWKIEMMNNATGEYEEMLRLRHEICYSPDKE